jgi:hypothetical protein
VNIIHTALIRLFFQEFFRLSFLDDAGEESFRRVMIGLLSGFVALGLWLPRMYVAKYESLASAGPVAYTSALVADQLGMIALPMFIVALAMALVSHSIYPDETDYRILMALPVSRTAIFTAKLCALLLFAAIFIVTTNAAIGIPFTAVSSGPLATHSWLRRGSTQLMAGIMAGFFAVGAIVALQGLVVVLSPRAWLRQASVAVQSLLVCTLIVLLPWVLRLPGQADQLRAQTGRFYFVPPAWFLGVQQLLLGDVDPYFIRLALFAVLGVVAVSGIAAICYAVIYSHFDRVIIRSDRKSNRASKRPISRFGELFWPEVRAVHTFTLKTLRRSGLHQLVFLGIASAGLAIVVNAISGEMSGRAQRNAVLWTPFVLIFACVLGLRLALLLPLNRRAAWIFRVTEDDTRRERLFPVVELVMVSHAVLFPMLVMLPLQVHVLGFSAALASAPVTVIMGVTLVEIVLMKWHRIPFSCSYLPGKRPVVHELLLLITSFGLFTMLGWALSDAAAARQTPEPVALCVVGTLAWTFRWLRQTRTAGIPMEFEDELPESTYGLKLNG